MLHFEETFMDFLLEHQERHNRTYHFLILMNSLLNAAKRIQHYYLTGALRGNLGLAGSTNVQGEEVLQMDEIANEVVKHYLASSGRVIHAVSEEEKEHHPDERRGRPLLRLLRPDGRLVERPPQPARSGSSSASPSATSTGPRTCTCGPGTRLHRLGHVRHPDRDVHHRPARTPAAGGSTSTRP